MVKIVFKRCQNASASGKDMVPQTSCWGFALDPTRGLLSFVLRRLASNPTTNISQILQVVRQCWRCQQPCLHTVAIQCWSFAAGFWGSLLYVESQFWFEEIKWQCFLYIVYKFGEIRSNNNGVYNGRMRTAGIDPTSHPVISESTGPIFTKFSGLLGIWENFIKHSFILQSLNVVTQDS